MSTTSNDADRRSDVAKKNKRIRGGHRAFVTRIIQSVQELLAEFDGSPSSVESLEGYRISLTEKKVVLASYDEKVLEDIEDEDEVGNDIFESSEFADTINRTLYKIKFCLHKNEKASEKLSTSIADNSDLSSPSNSLKETFVCKTKLPKLCLPRFSGDSKLWQPFWDSFQAAVDNNSAISNVEKFNYLKSLLDGPASSCVAGLSLIGENYDAAIQLLKDRFANKQVIISGHMDVLLNLQSVTSGCEVKHIRRLYDTIEVQIRSLKSMGVQSESYGNILIPIIMNKLPEELRLFISRGVKDWSVDEVLDILKTELEARERVDLMHSNSTKKSGYSLNNVYSPQSRSNRVNPSTASTLFSSKDQRPVPYCVFCTQQHPSVNCTSVTDISARKSILRHKAKCFLCLRSGHVLRNCPNRDYKCFNCGERHNKAICTYRPEQNLRRPSYVNKTETGQPSQTVTSNMTCTDDQNSILLQTAVGFVCANHNDNSRGLYKNIVFDLCSQRTYVTDETRRLLNLRTVGRENLLIKTFGEETPKLRLCDIVQFTVAGDDGLHLYVTAHCVPSICNAISDQLTCNALVKYPHLRGLKLANPSGPSDFAVDILIGADFYWNFFCGETRRGEFPGPVAMLTKLGWVLSGPVINNSSSDQCTINLSHTHVLHVSSVSDDNCDVSSIKSELNKFWELESLGIRNDESSVLSDFNDNITFEGKRYEVKLPFKENHLKISDNYSTCVKRLSSLLYRLNSKPDVLKEYDRIINEQLSEGIIDIVNDDDVIINSGSIHYIPHREVLRLDKDTTKLRVVYDASCKTSGPSLNECLYSGPSLNPLIFDILLRFRMNSIALTADIQKAFLNIAIYKEHRDFLRFLWVDDPFSESPKIKVFRFNRVVFGVTSSPFILNATLRYHLSNSMDDNFEILNNILKSLYVDDFASGADNVNSAYDLCKLVKLCLNQGGFNMRKWCSNSQVLMSMLHESSDFPEVEFDVKKMETDVIEDDTGYNDFVQNSNFDCNSVLGQKWDNSADMFQFEFDKILSSMIVNATLTKRQVLSTTAKFFDPVGLISPIVLLFKLCFQKLCENPLDWDDPLDNNFCDYWNNLVSSLSAVKALHINRCICYELRQANSIQFHVFGDASEKAYGSCVYIRCEHSDTKEIHCNLIASKTRVAPLKKQSIPRLELLACLISVRLAACVKEALKDIVDAPVYFWSDSQVALSWIKNTTREFKQFVNNRVVEIRDSSDVSKWSYCSTKENPADVASRGCKAVELVNNDLWWHGPPYLLSSTENWPRNVEETLSEPFYSEVKKATVCVANVETNHNIENILDVSRYSNFNSLLRVTAYVLRFVKNKRDNVQVQTDQLSKEEINCAENIWCRDIQHSLSGRKFEQQRLSLNLKPDDNGILRCYGRIDNSNLPFDAKFPIFLPDSHRFTSLIIEKCHRDVHHNGTAETLVQLRQKFWVCRGRQVVKAVITKCIPCRKMEGKSYGVPLAPPLPEFRLSDDFAFTNIGVDYAGPLYVKDIYSKSGEMNKVFIVLYTCASSRAVHLDLATDASSSSFIRSFRRFIGRRGVPTLVNSDNGLVFKSAELRAFTNSRNIKWCYNIERSPWWGGFFERMVRSTKRCLKKALGNAHLSYEELLTLLVDIEGVLNSRPLTYLSDDCIEPLTPSHLVLGRRILSEPLFTPNPKVVGNTSSEFCKRKKYLQTVINHYWSRWRNDYVTQLREHHRSRVKTGPIIREGDIVLVFDDKVSRLNWEMGRVDRILPGRDNNVRSAVVRVQNKQGKIIFMNRPIQKLYPIELVRD